VFLFLLKDTVELIIGFLLAFVELII
jgi:hypothetical protein